MADYSYMDDRLYKAARSKGTQIPSPADDDDGGLYYLRVTPGDGSNALHVAALHGNHEFVQAILGHDSVVPADELILCKHNSKGETPLHLAAKSGCAETVKAILETQVACWKDKDKQGDTPLHVALRFGHDEIALLMLERDLQYLVTLDNNVGESLAYLAAQNCCQKFLRKILDADGDGLCCISFSGPFGQTAFHPARNLTGDILSMSIERRKHLLKVQDKKGKTVLHYAVEEDRYPTVEILLKADSSLGYLHDNDGMTPLHIAASRGLLDIIHMILELCPQSITMLDKRHGRTALHFVKLDGYSLVKCLKNTRMRELINEADNDGNTPLHLALMISDVVTADKLLMVDGINLRLTNKLGYSPMGLCNSDELIPLKLRLADESRAKEVMKMDVFFHKSVVNADDVLDCFTWDECLAFKGPQGDNILHTASRDGNLKIINRIHECDAARVLLLSGRNSKGETPLHLAAEYGHLEVVKLILSLTNSEENGTPSTSTIVAIENGLEELVNVDPTGDCVMPWRIRSANGDTPAHKAIRSRHAKVALLFLQCDPELITANNDAKESLLYLAADSKCYDVIESILLQSRQLDDSITSGGSGQNFFHAMARCSRYLFNKLKLMNIQLHLIQKVDDDGKTPLHYAIEERSHKTAQWLLKQDKSAAFVYDNEGCTPLLRAVILCRIECIQSILTLCPQSAKLRYPISNKTVLHLASLPVLFLRKCMRYKEVRKLLNETDKDGNTALHCAIIDGDTDKALVLLQTPGMNWTIRNNQYKTPKDLCQQLSINGETIQRPISIELAVLSMEQGIMGSLLASGHLIQFAMINTDENLKKTLDKIAVAAALLTTVTFAALFTIPGGYNQDTGEVVLMKKFAVQVFIASDTLAMLMAISILLWYTIGCTRTGLRRLTFGSLTMIQYAVVATIISFIAGVYAIGWHVKAVVIFPIVIAVLFNLNISLGSDFLQTDLLMY